MKLGVCYHPEHWPQKRWPIDARLMRQAGLSLVRIADFTWAAMEPSEGEFTWKWLDQAIEVLAAESLQVILCTPTASPPPWRCRTYPDILPVDAQGHRLRQGGRRHYCSNSTSYQQQTVRIVSALASRYGGHPAVVGWQIDNELGWAGTAHCYCEVCASVFRTWLQRRYGTIDALNEAWGTIFWSQTYRDWTEIDLPNLTVGEPNPSHRLDYYRFSSDSIVAYQQLQINSLQAHVPAHQKITTNFMSQYSDLNYYDLARSLNFVSMSSYPTGQADAKSTLYMPGSSQPTLAYDVGDPYVTSLWHTLMRGYQPHRPFWVMEQQCSNINWSRYNTGIRPGTVRLWTWHALASGAEAVVYFRWRAGRFGQEQLHSGLLHHDASPAVGLNDVQSMSAEQSLMAEIAAMPQEAQIAFLLDYDSLWAVKLQPHHADIDYLRHLFICFRALMRLGLPADIVSTGADLSGYKLVVLPTAYVITDQLAHSLKRFVEAGGTALFGVRSGVKTASNLVTDCPLPGSIRHLVGITVNDWHSLPPQVSYQLNSSIPDLTGPATVWAEALELGNAQAPIMDSALEVLARYTSGPFSSCAALVKRQVGAGNALYLGWHPDERQAEVLLGNLAARVGILPIADLAEGLIASRRGPYRILLNFTDEPLMATVGGRTVWVGPRNVEIVKM